METVRVYSWKPANSINFGDEIGPMIVQALCQKASLDLNILPTTSPTHSKLLAVGSVLHEARGSDVVWGVGINSKHQSLLPKNANIRFNAVRGPLTRSIVRDQGFNCPEVYGDPGLLFPMLFDQEIRARRAELEQSAHELGTKMPKTIVIPNINDDRFLPYFTASKIDEDVMFVRPNFSPITVAAYISAARRVICSSLHGLVFADVYARSTTRMISHFEPEFKYSDYYEGTGRRTPRAYPDLRSALDGEEIPRLDWDPEPILNAFPLFDENIVRSLSVTTFQMKPNKPYEVAELSDNKTPLVKGWAKPTSGSAWSTETWAEFEFLVKESLSPGAKLRMRVGTLSKGAGAFVLLRVVHKGAVIATHQILRNEPGHAIEVPLPAPENGGEIALRFKIENASKPVDYGLGPDPRALGIWLSNFEITS